MKKVRLAGFISAQANLRQAQIERSGRGQNKARAMLREAEQVQDSLDGER